MIAPLVLSLFPGIDELTPTAKLPRNDSAATVSTPARTLTDRRGISLMNALQAISPASRKAVVKQMGLMGQKADLGRPAASLWVSIVPLAMGRAVAKAVKRALGAKEESV